MSTSVATRSSDGSSSWLERIARWRRQGRIDRGGVMAMIALAIVLPFVASSQYDLGQFQLMAIYGLVATALNWNLIAGELVLGQSAIFGAGAYTAAILLHRTPDLNTLLVFLASIGVSTCVGVIVAIPGLRVGKWFVAMLSFFMIVVAQDLISQMVSLTGGAAGLNGLPAMTLFGWTVSNQRVLYFVCVALLGLALLMSRNLFRSSWGASLSTMRSSDRAADSLGISRYRTKLVVYTLSGIPCGVAGALFVYSTSLVLPDLFSINLTVLFLAAVVLGGERRLLGPIIGIGILQAFPMLAVSFQTYELFFYGGFLVIMTIAIPGGIIGTLRSGVSLLTRRVAVRDALSSPSAATDGHRDDGDVEVRDGRPEPAAVPDGQGTGGWPWASTGTDLVVEEVSKSFAGLSALNDVSLTVKPGQLHGLIGANGSGKTTLLNIMSGYYRADAGRIRMGDVELLGRPTYRIARAGVGRTFQTPDLPEDLNAREAVIAALHWRRRATIIEHMLSLRRSRRERKEFRAEADRLLVEVGLGDQGERRATELSLGHRRLLELARVLALRPSMLLLDEPASGLSEGDLRQFRRVLKDLCAQGLGIVLVEHNLPLVTDLADVISVLDQGQLIACGTPDVIRNHPDVIKSYIGEATGDRVLEEAEAALDEGLVPAESGTGIERDALLQVEGVDVDLSGVPVLHSVSLEVKRGDVEVILGPNGAGKTTLMRAISGLAGKRNGRVLLEGKEISKLRANRIASMGVQHVQEGKRVFRRLTVDNNLTLGERRRDRKIESVFTREDVYELFPVLLRKRFHIAGNLSGGEQQMLAIGQALLAAPSVLLLDEPSAGLSPLLVRQMFDAISKLRDAGMTVLLVEQIVDQSLGVGDDASILLQGRIVFSDSAKRMRANPDLKDAYFKAGVGK